MKPLALSFVVACVVALVPAEARAADELGLSSDGTTWSADLNQPLFDPSLRWIPGDREESAFYARNQSADTATLDIAVLGFEAGTTRMLHTGELAVEVRAGDGPWQRTNLTGRQSLVSSLPVAAGQEMKVSVAATFPYGTAAQNQSQVRELALVFEVRLTQDSVGADDRDDSDDSGADRDRNGILPGAGGPVWWLLPAGLLGVGAGWLTVAVNRRREERVDV